MRDSAIFAHRFFIRAGLSLVNVFAWIFIFEYFFIYSGDMGRALAACALLYALTQLVTMVATPVSASHLQRGTKHSIIWGAVFAAAAFIFLGGTVAGFFSDPPAWGIVAFAVLYGAYRALYWVPYQLAVADNRPHLHMRSYLEALIAFMPLFSGLTLVTVPFGRLKLLFGAAVIILLSAVPAMYLQDTRERFSWSTMYAFSQLWRQKNHGLVLQSLLEGVQGAALFLVWPLAIFLILGRSYLWVGLVFTLTLLFIMLFRRIYSKAMAALDLKKSETVGVVVAVSGWIARFAAGTPLGIIVADVYSYTTAPNQGTYSDPAAFEQSSDRGAFLDEYTALKEMALAAGRIMLSICVFFLVFVFSVPVVLGIAIAMAAAASGLSTVLARRVSTATY